MKHAHCVTIVGAHLSSCAAASSRGLSRAAAAHVLHVLLGAALGAVSQAFTLAAKRRLHSVSCALAGSGLTFTNISVLPLPPRHGCARKEDDHPSATCWYYDAHRAR